MQIREVHSALDGWPANESPIASDKNPGTLQHVSWAKLRIREIRSSFGVRIEMSSWERVGALRGSLAALRCLFEGILGRQAWEATKIESNGAQRRGEVAHRKLSTRQRAGGTYDGRCLFAGTSPRPPAAFPRAPNAMLLQLGTLWILDDPCL